MYIFCNQYLSKCFCTLILCMFIWSYGSAEDLSWVNRYGATGEDAVNASAVDSLNNLYTTGVFSGAVDFNEGKGSAVQLTSLGGLDIFITKTGSDGTLLWAKRIGSTGSDYGLALDIDDRGAVYVTGRFAGTVDFDPGLGVFNLKATSGYDIFVLKLDTSGDFIWAKKMGGTGWDVGNAIAVDKDRNVVVTGRFDGTANFNTNTNGTEISLTATG